MGPKENLIQALTRGAPERVPHQYEPTWDRLAYDGAHPQDWAGDEALFFDHWGVGWERTEDDWGATPFPAVHPLANLSKLATYKPPDPDEPGFTRVLEGLREPGKLHLAHLPLGPFDRAWALTGMDNFFVTALTDIDSARLIVEMVTDYIVRMSRRLVRAGLEMCWLTDDYGTERALMMSPETWRKLFKPALAEIFSVWKDAGRLIGLHSCGAVGAIVGDLVEIGLDVLHPVQASCNDAAALKARWGDRLSFWGGVSSRVLLQGAPADVQRETLRALKALGPDGGYVCGQDQTMPYPEANIAALAETVERFGAYPLDLPEAVPPTG
ncbi:MAG: hypothetical protein M5R40_05350 [Anaerolineae bacterium]|nr:hypothetical protein [Anaerolineae bacterium]